MFDHLSVLQVHFAHFVMDKSHGLQQAGRPNSMNNYGLILTEIGLKPSLLKLQQAMQPIARALFPLEGEHLDDFHSFVVSAWA